MSDGRNSLDFWKNIGKLGLANERNQTTTMEVLDENADIKTDTNEILNKWTSNYSHLYNGV